MTGLNGHSSLRAGSAAIYIIAVLGLAIMLGSARPLSAQSTWKGVWEPVNYKGDIQFGDVYFATADKGWVAGVGSHTKGGGVILHTKDGGRTWSIQYGDPESSDRVVADLFFLDERRGWARQGSTLLRTTDGENWETAGTVRAEGYVFVSPTVGFMAERSELKRTDNGGQSWTTVGKCSATVDVGGLSKREDCSIRSIHFPSRKTGYAVGDGYAKAFYLMKTTDGGRSWTATGVPAESGGYDVFFTDDRRGVVRTKTREVYGTEDGGSTWKRLTGNPIADLRFADPVVGWSIAYKEMNYTTNGGRSWLKRNIEFPGMVSAFSLPRRDRGYAVGDNGMIYRYSVVKASQSVAGGLSAPAMPAFETLLDEKVEALDDFVESLEESVAKMPDGAAGSSGNGGSPGGTASSATAPWREAAAGSDDVLFSESTDASGSASSFGQTSGTTAAAPSSSFIEKCCVKSVSGWYLAMQAAESILPQFVAQFKNTNLLGAGLRMLVVLPARVNAASAAFTSFKKSQSKDEAKANVAQLQAAVDALKQGVSSALQKEVPST